jgi:hypothetical protein
MQFFNKILDLVALIGCVLLILLGCVIATLFSSEMKVIDVISSITELVGAAGGIFAGLAALGGISIWREQVKLPRGLSALDELHALTYDVKQILDKCYEAEFKIFEAELFLNTDIEFSKNPVTGAYAGPCKTYTELVSFLGFEQHRREVELYSALNRYRAQVDKCAAYGLDGLKLCEELKDHCLRELERHYKQMGNYMIDGNHIGMKLAHDQIKREGLGMFDSLIDEIIQKYKAG